MTKIKIGIPPVVIEITVEDLKDLSKVILRLLKRTKFNGYYHIIAKHSGKCMDVDGASKDDRANVQQYFLHGGDNQQWILVQTPDNCYFIFAKHSGKCLDVEGYNLDDRANVFQHTLNGGNNQKWELRDCGDGYFNILAKHSGKALDVEGYSVENGANVFQYPLNGGDNQKWKLQPVIQGGKKT